MAKRSSDPEVAYPEFKLQVRDLMRVVGIVAPFAPLRKNSSYRAPGGKRAQETGAGSPTQRYVTGEPGKLQRRNRVENVDVFCGHRARGVSIRGKSALSRNLGYKTTGSLCG